MKSNVIILNLFGVVAGETSVGAGCPLESHPEVTGDD